MKIKGLLNKVKLPARASAFYLGAGAVGKLVGVIFTPVFTRILTRSEYGEYTRYLSIIGAVSVICSALTSSSVIYKGLGEQEAKREDYLKGVLVANLLFLLVICSLLFAFSRFLALNSLIVATMSLQIFADSITAIYLTGAKFSYKYPTVTAVLLIGSILPPTLSALLIFAFGGGYLIRVYSLLAVSFVIGLFALIKLVKGGKAKSYMIKNTLLNCLPLLPHGISNAVSSQADKLILASIMGSVALAKYSVVFSLGMALQFTVTALGSALSPWIIRRIKSGEENKISSLIFPMMIGYLALSVCLIAIGPEAIKILAPEDYLDAFPALMPIALSVPFSFISLVCTVALVYFGKARFTAALSTVSGIGCILLNYTLIDFLGYIGAGLSLMICQMLLAIGGVIELTKIGHGEIICARKILPTYLVGIGCGAR